MGKRYLIDSNIFTKFFNATLSERGMLLLSSLDKDHSYISTINRIELLGWASQDAVYDEKLKEVLEEVNELLIDESVILKTIEIRKKYKIKLPDAIIAATVMVYELILLSDNDSDFGKIANLSYINPRKF